MNTQSPIAEAKGIETLNLEWLLAHHIAKEEHRTKTYAVQLLPPLTAEIEAYIKGNVEWFGTVAQPYLSNTDYQAWFAHFDPASEQYIFDRDDFYFCMMEVLTIGTVC